MGALKEFCKTELGRSKEMKRDTERIMIIDGLNMFLRNLIVNPSLSTNGDPIGGVKGFLASVQKMIRELKPDRIIVAWDGPGGSQKRRAQNKNYKAGRKPIRFNRGVKLMSEEEETKNKIWQQTRLLEYINMMPIPQILLQGIEADDVIAKICRTMRGCQKVIVSSDKDFIQLCDEETVLYRPIQKQLVTKKTVLEEHQISPTNFAMARAIAGDKSDNLAGVPGAGLKTIAKRLPFLKEEKDATFEDIFKACEKEEKKLKFHNGILENKDLIKKNYGLMQLYTPNISPNNSAVIKEAIEEIKPDFNKTNIIKMMNEDGFGVYDWGDLWRFCRKNVVDLKNKV